MLRLGEADVGPWSSSLAFWPRAPREVGNLSVGTAPTWDGIPEEEEAGTVLGSGAGGGGGLGYG